MAHEHLDIPGPQAPLPNEKEAATASLLAFRAGSWGFFLPIGLHCEIIEAMQINPIPKVEPWFDGLLNIRGNIVPVVDLYLLPGVTARPPKKRYLLALGQGGKTMVLWIDGYPQMLANIDGPLPILPPLPQQLLPCIHKAYRHQGQLWLLAQFDPLFKTLGSNRTSEESTL